MSKTKELAITCSGEIKISASRGRSTIYIEEPEVEEALTSFNSQDLIQYVAYNYGADEVFDEKELSKWAEGNGYIKEQTND